MTKFQVGDTVRVVNHNFVKNFPIGTRFTVFSIIEKASNVAGTCYYSESKNYPGQSGAGHYESELELVQSVNNIKNKQQKSFMSKFTSFVKNQLLSDDEKVLRKFQLKTDCGDYTEEAKELVLNKLVSDNEDYLIKVAKEMALEEAKANK